MTMTPRLPTVMRIVREQKGLTQSELAGRVGKLQGDISLYENAEMTIRTVETRQKLAEALDLHPDDLQRPYAEWLAEQQAISCASYQLDPTPDR